MEISRKLYLLRTDHGMTQAEFAKIAGVSDKAISSWEKGIRSPKVQYIMPICDYFGIDLNTFVDESNDIYRPEQKPAPRETTIPLDFGSTSMALYHDLGDGEASLPNISGRPGTGKSGFIKSLFDGDGEAEKIARRFMDLDDHGKGAVRAILDFEEAAVVAERRQSQKKGRPVRPRPDGFTSVIVYDQVSAAGLGNYLDDPVSHEEQYPANKVPEGTEFGVRISGTSMAPTIPDGATAFVQSRSAIQPGQIGIFLVSGEAFCKKLVVDRQSRRIILKSLNPEAKDRIVEESDTFSTMGLVLGWWPENA